MDEQGNIVDENNLIVNKNGEVIGAYDENGNIIDETGHLVNKNGQLIDE